MLILETKRFNRVKIKNKKLIIDNCLFPFFTTVTDLTIIFVLFLKIH